MSQVLKVEDLGVTFALHDTEVQAVRDLNFTLNQGETLAVVESQGLARARPSWPSWASWPRTAAPQARPCSAM